MEKLTILFIGFLFTSCIYEFDFDTEQDPITSEDPIAENFSVLEIYNVNDWCLFENEPGKITFKGINWGYDCGGDLIANHFVTLNPFTGAITESNIVCGPYLPCF